MPCWTPTVRRQHRYRESTTIDSPFGPIDFGRLCGPSADGRCPTNSYFTARGATAARQSARADAARGSDPRTNQVSNSTPDRYSHNATGADRNSDSCPDTHTGTVRNRNTGTDAYGDSGPHPNTVADRDTRANTVHRNLAQHQRSARRPVLAL